MIIILIYKVQSPLRPSPCLPHEGVVGVPPPVRGTGTCLATGGIRCATGGGTPWKTGYASTRSPGEPAPGPYHPPPPPPPPPPPEEPPPPLPEDEPGGVEAEAMASLKELPMLLAKLPTRCGFHSPEYQAGW